MLGPHNNNDDAIQKSWFRKEEMSLSWMSGFHLASRCSKSAFREWVVTSFSCFKTSIAKTKNARLVRDQNYFEQALTNWNVPNLPSKIETWCQFYNTILRSSLRYENFFRHRLHYFSVQQHISSLRCCARCKQRTPSSRNSIWWGGVSWSYTLWSQPWWSSASSWSHTSKLAQERNVKIDDRR